ncbi:peptidylprolyl isomerase [Vibrio sonorensis]|uniref:peptidylprolyl isomerase n=1 Tax=Vibrio sonorensis TaxID=1004316 RepID=UPI0008D90389|nr:peptidylprolyl isomerase [Vibrio sonorensis]
MKKTLFAVLALVSQLAFAGPTVMFETNLGPFVVELNQEKAPVTVKNFLRYVEDGSYKGSVFHRVIPGFMAQGGGFTPEMERIDTYAPIENEAANGLKNEVGSIAMARTNDPNSATRQFFINYKDNNFLDYANRPPGYAVFGKVVKGFEVVEEMATKPTGRKNRYQDVPLEPIVITNVTIVE